MRNALRSRLYAIVTVSMVLLLSQPGAASAAALSTAQPSIVNLTCPGSLTATFSPGFSLFPAHQTVTGVLKGGTDFLPGLACTSLTGGAPYTGVSVTFAGSGDVSCVAADITGTALLTWNNGDTSTVSMSEIIVPVVPVISATVISGALKGSTIVLTGAPTGLTGVCGIFSPTTSLSFIGVATFLHL